MRASSAPPARAWRVPLRLAFALAWLGTQAALVLTASRRAEAAFGFRMFAESSTISAHLSRAVSAPSGHGTIDVPVQGGEWVARGPDGRPHRVRWRDRIIEGNLASFDITMQASYSAAAQVERWRAALEDVAAHLAEDSETRALSLDLVIRKNGREPTTYHFTSPRR